MVAAIQGKWRLTLARPEGAGSVTFTLEPGPKSNSPLAYPPTRTPQCGTRTFTRPAAACGPESILELAAHVVEADPALDTADGKGWYAVAGLQYRGGNIELRFGSNLHVSAYLEASNAVRQTDTDWQGARVTSLLERATK